MALSVHARASHVEAGAEMDGKTCARHGDRPALWAVELIWQHGMPAATITLCDECVDRVKHSDYKECEDSLPF